MSMAPNRPIRDPAVLLRKHYVQIVSSALLLITPLWVILQLVAGIPRPSLLLPILLSPVVYLVNFWLAQRNWVNASVILLQVILFISLGFATDGGQILYAMLNLITAALIAGRWVFIAINALVMGKLLADVVGYAAASGMVITPDFNGRIILIVTVAVASIVLRYFFNSLNANLVGSKRAADLLATTADIGRVTAGIMNPAELLSRAVEYIRERFQYHYVQVFLVDETNSSFPLVAAAGRMGAELLEEGYSLQPSVVQGLMPELEAGTPIVNNDVDQRVLIRRRDVQSNTRSEVLLPISDGERLIGVLSVQSTVRTAFSANDAQALQIMANLLGTSVRNARLFEAQKRAVQENKRLFLESEANLREIRRLNQQLTKAGWVDYLAQRPAVQGINLEQNQVILDSRWSDTLAEAVTRRRAISKHEGAEQTIAVPILLRGEVLGAIEIQPGEATHEQDTIEMIQAVAQRLATSLESARLFEETQEATVYEQRINEIAEQYQQAGTVDELLRITLKELSRTLGAQQGAIRLGGTPPPNDEANAASGSDPAAAPRPLNGSHNGGGA